MFGKEIAVLGGFTDIFRKYYRQPINKEKCQKLRKGTGAGPGEHTPPVSHLTLLAAAGHLHGLAELWQKAALSSSTCHALCSTASISLWTLVVQDLAQSMKQGKASVFAKARPAAAAASTGGCWQAAFCLALLASLGLLAAGADQVLLPCSFSASSCASSMFGSTYIVQTLALSKPAQSRVCCQPELCEMQT